MGLWTRIRQNLSLKIISLIAAILLYIYVQQERNPTIQRTLLTNVEYKNRQSGLSVVPDGKSIMVTVTGPRPSVERLKDGDVKATADLSNVTSNQPSVPVRISYELPKGVADVSIDPAQEFIKVQVFQEKSRKMDVTPVYKQDPPAGMKYAEPVIRPSRVTVRGREDFVNRVSKVVASATPTEPRSSIDGDFTLQALDSDNNVVEGVSLDPDKVHVTVSQVFLPSERTVLINAVVADRPVLPYSITEWITSPNQVKVVGTPERVAEIHAIYTETLSTRDLTATKTLDAALIIPPDVQVLDLSGKPITHAKVRFVIAKAKTEPTTGPEVTPAPGPPRHDTPGAGQ